MSRWLSAFLGAALGAAAVIVALWGALLLIDPAEMRHYEYALPALGFAAAAFVGSIFLLRR